MGESGTGGTAVDAAGSKPRCSGRSTTFASSSTPPTRCCRRSVGSPATPTRCCETILDSACRLCRSDAALIYFLEDGVFRLTRSVGVSEESVRYITDHPLALDRRSLSGRVGARRARRARSRTCSRTPSSDASTSSGWPGSARRSRRRCCSTTEVVGVLNVWRTDVRPFDARETAIASAFAGQAATGGQPGQARPAAAGAERRAGGRQPAQVGVPGQHVPRAADAAQRRARVLRGAAGADVRRPQRAPGGVPPRHPRLRAPPARAARTRSSTSRRSRPGGWSWSTRRSTSRRCSTTPRRCCASGRPPHGIDCASTSRRRHRRRVRRRAPAQAGRAQPDDQRGEVHRRRRLRGRPGRAATAPRSRSP